MPGPLFFMAGALQTPVVDSVLVNDATYSIENSLCSFTLNSDGTISIAADETQPSGLGDSRWIEPTSSAPGLYEAQATVVSGSGTGTTGSWLALTTNRTWSVFRSPRAGSGTDQFIIDIEIRLNGGSTLTTGRIDLSSIIP